MAKFVSKRDESVRLFQNPVLEYFSHVHPATPLVVYGPLVIGFAVWAVLTLNVVVALAWAAGGLLLWTLVEYVVHRLLFHFEPRSALGRRLVFLMHGVHHDYPQDRTRLVMPLLVTAPLAVALYFLFRWLFGAYWPAVAAGFGAGYVAYDTVHFMIHHWPMRGPVGRWLKRHHLRHHFNQEHAGYGVSSPLWDYVFGTAHPASTPPYDER